MTLLGWRHTEDACGLQSRRAFRAQLEREKYCADRYEYQFSLILYDMGEPISRSIRASQLARLIHGRIRKCDVPGWYDRQRMGILLPFTSPIGARELAADLQRRMPGNLPAYVVHGYPYDRDEDAQDKASGGSAEFLPEPVALEEGTADGGLSAREGIVRAVGRGFSEHESAVSLLVPPTPFWKRSMDVMGAIVGFVLLAPLFVGIAAFIKATSPGPAFFLQQRVGFQGKPFTIWKFRTMHVNADAGKHKHYVTDLVDSDQALQKLDMKSQMVPLGKWLRRLGLDELPQLINILCGSMSLVGPRPDVVPLDAYSPWQRRRFDVLPGVTGLWQVRGKNGTTFRQMVRLDIAYAQRRSLGLDLRILLMTAPAIIRQINED